MRKISKYINRSECVLTGKDSLEDLYTFKNFPVFMGCVESPIKEDLIADMEWGIDPDTGVIQLSKLLPTNILYLNQHNDGVGKVWRNHYEAFAKFLSKYGSKNVLEIGGAHDHIFKFYKELNSGVSWTTVEPNPERITDPSIKIIKGWFDDGFSTDIPVDTVVHSHVFEHTYDPVSFMRHVGDFLKYGEMQVFSLPSMIPMLENNFTNCLNFEHTVLLSEPVIEYILSLSGFRIIGKEYYGSPHSIFYATEKISMKNKSPILPKEYDKNKILFESYVKYHINMVKKINDLIKNSDSPVYLFGAHIFSQYLIHFGLNVDSVVAILDNSEIKNNKRLYGTSLIVKSPKVLRGVGSVNVILKAGIYDEEIKKDIIDNINPNVTFW